MPLPFMNSPQDMSSTGLTEEELEQMGKMTGAGKDKGRNKKSPKDKTFSSEENETVTLVRHNEVVAEYKERIDKLNAKIEEGKKTIQTLRDEKAAAENKVERLKQELADLGAASDGKQTRINESADEISRLKKEKAQLEKEKAQLEKDIDTAAEDAQKELMKDLETAQEQIDALKDGKSALEQRIRELETQIGVLRADKDELNAKLEESRSAQPQRAVEKPDVVGIITRTGPTSFSSTLFISQRYTVSAARSGNYLSFDPNIQGNIECIDHVLTIPGLDRLFPYNGTMEHSAVRKGTKFVIYLHSASQ